MDYSSPQCPSLQAFPILFTGTLSAMSVFPVLLVLMAYGAGGVWQRYARTGTPMKAAMAAASFAASTDPLESAALIRE